MCEQKIAKPKQQITSQQEYVTTKSVQKPPKVK